MLRKYFTRKAAQKIASNYASYSDFAQRASDKEKQKIIIEALVKANKMQQQVAGFTR